VKINYLNKNCPLEKLWEMIVNFMKQRGFKFSESIDSVSRELLAFKRSVEENLTLRVYVKLYGEPSNFIVEIFCPDVSDSFYLLSGMLSMIGLGGIFQRKMKIYDAYKKFESDFLSFIDGALNLS